MSARDILLYELQRQPDSVASKLLEYLHTLVPETSQTGGPSPERSDFSSHWNRFYGAFEGEPWEEPAELPVEKREEW
mgnify:CR=1 FL=1